MTRTYTHEELKQLLPHRDPMLLLDSATLADDGVARGRLAITGDEFFCQGHFPGNPLLPGVIQCEILAQTCCVLMGGKKGTPVFTGLTNVKFRRPVRPGEVFETEVRLTRQRGQFFWGAGAGKVGGELCVQAEFSFALVDAQAGE